MSDEIIEDKIKENEKIEEISDDEEKEVSDDEEISVELSIEDDLKNTKEEVYKLKDQLLRAFAETENVRKRASREKEETIKYSTSKFARDMLSVSDNLRRALNTINDEDKKNLSDNLKSMLDGIEITEKELLNAFKKNGIGKIDPKEGEKFSHEIHQAMFEAESKDFEAGSIMQILQPGYMIHERLLRPAMVGVVKKSSK